MAVTGNSSSSGSIIPSSVILTIRGDVGAADYPAWITHRANRLGLSGWARPDPNGKSIEVFVCGPPDLIDAMELGCSLGPMSVWVEKIDRAAGNDVGNQLSDGFEILAGQGQTLPNR